MSASIRKGRVIGSVAATIIALVSITVGIAGPATAAPSSPVMKYVALGDSIAAGQGGGGEVPSCMQSPAGYPALLDAEPRTNLLRNPSCTGATLIDVAATQVSQLNRGTTLVTVTAGVNGLNLPLLLSECTPDPSVPACTDAVGAASFYVESQAGPELGAVIGEASIRSPRALIVITGYPLPFAPSFDPVKSGANELANALNNALALTVAAAAAQGANVVYADVATRFVGHGAGSADPWVGVNAADPVTFLHPNAAGYIAYRDAVLAAVGP